MALKLKVEEKCDLVIALTHLRILNERILGKEVSGIDLMLGGHDHLFHIEMLGDEVFFLKSGTDFEDFSDLIVYLNPSEEEIKEIM